MKRLVVVVLAAVLVGGCVSTPPLPPECEGDLVPINGAASVSKAGGGGEPRSSR